MDTTDNVKKAEHASLRGRSAELLVAAFACRLGCGVSLALSAYQKYDLIIDHAGHLRRTQVKLAFWIEQRQRKAGRGDRAHWRVDLSSDAQGKTRQYTHTDFDLLAVVCDPSRIYVIPVRVLYDAATDRLQRHVHIKPAHESLTRADAKQSAARWEEYLNCLPPRD